MSGFWSVIDPEEGTNLVHNPSAETTGNYAPIGATVTQSLEQSRHGIRSWKVVTAATSQGLFLFCTTGTNTTHYASAYVRGTITGTLSFSMTSGTNKNAASVIGGRTGGFVRYGVAIPPAQTSQSPYLSIFDSANDGTLYIDAVQLEAKTYPTTYIDGDRDGLYRWNELRNASSSTRDAMERSGGVERDLDTYYKIQVRPSFSGVGMPPIVNNIQPMALQPGSLLQSQKVLPREIVLDFVINATTGSTWQTLHQQRQKLINLVKPDRARGAQPFTLVYKGGAGASGADTPSRNVYAKFVYKDGLEFGGVEGFVEEPNVRLLAVDPFWYSDDQEQVALSIQTTQASANNIIMRNNGAWSNMGVGTTGGYSYIMAVDTNNRLYVGGSFLTAGGISNSTALASWDGTTWAALGTGVNSTQTYALAIGPDDAVYVGGDWTRAGGVTNTTGIAKWSGTAWSAMGTSITSGAPPFNKVYALAAAPDGAIYAGGTFLEMGGVSGTLKVAKWTGSAWTSMGAGINSTANEYVYALAVGKDGKIYASGSFSRAGGVTNTTGVAYWNGSSWNAMGTGLAGNVYTLEVSPDGSVYAGGDFTLNGKRGLAKWNGASWETLGDGLEALTGYPRKIRYIQGALWVVGSFTSAGGMTLQQPAVVWNGTTYTKIDAIFPSTAVTIYDVIEDLAGKLYYSYVGVGTATVSKQTSVVPNATENTYPKILCVGPTTAGTTANIVWIENQSTSERLYLNIDLQGGGEVVTLDLTPGGKSVSSNWRGGIYGQPMSGSDFSAFHLAPTTNTISTFICGTTAGVSAIMTWTPTMWSADGGA